MNRTSETPNLRRSYVLGLAVAFAVLVADQITKWWIHDVVMQPPRVIDVLPFFKLVLAWNPGIAFSMFDDSGVWGPWILSAIALAIVAAMLVWLRTIERDFLRVAVGLIVGGAIGNVIDRVRFGAVVDFLYFHYGAYGFPAFNVADSAITIGVALVLIDGLFGGGRADAQGGAKDENERRKEPS